MTQQQAPSSTGQFTPGQTVYDREGRSAQYVVEVPGHGHLVCPLLVAAGCEDEDAYLFESAQTVLWPIVSAEPPSQLIAAEVATAQATLAKVCEDIARARAELHSIGQQRRDQIKAITATDGLEHLEAFIAGKITHIVEGYYGIGYKTLDEYRRQERCDNRGNVPLIALLGNTKGKLDWGISGYADGSGPWMICIPCTSEEEAIGHCRRLVGDEMKKATTLQQQVSVAKTGIRFGMEFSDELMEAVRKSEIDPKVKDVEKARAELARVEAVLAAATGSAQ